MTFGFEDPWNLAELSFKKFQPFSFISCPEIIFSINVRFPANTGILTYAHDTTFSIKLLTRPSTKSEEVHKYNSKLLILQYNKKKFTRYCW